MKKCLANNKGIIIIISIVICAFMLLLTISENPVSFDDRTIGQALMRNIDITNLINIKYLFYFIIVPGLLCLVFYYIKKNINLFSESNRKAIMCLIGLGIVDFIIFTIYYFNTEKFGNILYISTIIIIELIIMILLLNKFSKKIKFDMDKFKWSCLASIPLILCSLLLENYIIKTLIPVWLVFPIIVIIMYIIVNNRKISFNILSKSYLIFMIAPILESIFLELYNILNQYNIFLDHKVRYIIIIYLICFILMIFKYFITIKKNTNQKFSYQKYYYPIAIITFSLIIAMPSMVTLVDTDLFEQANHGLGIYEFLKYHKIPILENFDAHMLSKEFLGIIYGLLNNDYLGAAFNVYSKFELIIFYLLVYYLFSKVFSKDYAFILVMFFPLTIDIGLNYNFWSFLVILTLLYSLKKKTFISYLFYFLSLAFLCLWRLDIGFAASLASLVILIYFSIKEKANYKKILLSFLSVILTFIILYISLCLIKNINPISRAIEFLKLSMSNINWAYEKIGSPNLLAYTIFYVLAPVFVVTSVIYQFYKINKSKDSNSFNIIILFLGLYYIFNFSRGIVRHSLFENDLRIVCGLLSIYIPLFIYQFNIKKSKNWLFCINYFVIITASQLLISPNILNYNNLFNESITKYQDFNVRNSQYNQKINRVELSNNLKLEYQDLKKVLNNILDEDETFLDFSNQTLLYALLDYKKPVYVNQSPGLLSGEYTQQLFLQEQLNYNVPVVIKAKEKLLSSSLDDIPNDFRYYLISEYIYNNYEPVLIVNGYEVWIKKDVVEEKVNILNNSMNVNINWLDKNNYFDGTLNVDLGYIPYIWGQYDEQSKNSSNKINLNNTNEINIDINRFNKNFGNYLELDLESAENQIITLEFKNNDNNLMSIKFNTLKGRYKYKIRVSAFYEWYQGNINKFFIKADNVSINSVFISKGDILNYKYLN